MTAADDLVHVDDQHPPHTATVRAHMSAHRLTDRMLVVLLAIAGRKLVDRIGGVR